MGFYLETPVGFGEKTRVPQSVHVPDDTLVTLCSTGQIATGFEEIPRVTWLGCVGTTSLHQWPQRLVIEETLLAGEWFMSLGQLIPTREINQRLNMSVRCHSCIPE